MSEKIASLIAACAVVFVGLASVAPAVARERPITVTATAEDIPVRIVSYRDLNLAMAEHEQVLVQRVRFAAKSVCNESVQYDEGFGAEMRRCRVQAFQGAKPQIDRAVTRARQIAANGSSAIAPVGITISVR